MVVVPVASLLVAEEERQHHGQPALVVGVEIVDEGQSVEIRRRDVAPVPEEQKPARERAIGAGARVVQERRDDDGAGAGGFVSVVHAQRDDGTEVPEAAVRLAAVAEERGQQGERARRMALVEEGQERVAGGAVLLVARVPGSEEAAGALAAVSGPVEGAEQRLRRLGVMVREVPVEGETDGPAPALVLLLPPQRDDGAKQLVGAARLIEEPAQDKARALLVVGVRDEQRRDGQVGFLRVRREVEGQQARRLSRRANGG